MLPMPYAAPHFEAVLDSPQKLARFTEHLSKRFCSENLEFYHAVTSFRMELDHSERLKMAAELAHRFLRPGASNELNLASGVRRAALDAVSTAPLDGFDSVLVEVLRLLEHDAALMPVEPT